MITRSPEVAKKLSFLATINSSFIYFFLKLFIAGSGIYSHYSFQNRRRVEFNDFLEVFCWLRTQDRSSGRKFLCSSEHTEQACLPVGLIQIFNC